MMKKIIASLFLTSLLGGCIVHTHGGSNRARRGCPRGYYFDNGGCHHDNGHHNGNRGGGVVVRDHRR